MGLPGFTSTMQGLMCLVQGNKTVLPFGLQPTTFLYQSKKEGKDQESIQLSTTPDPGYQWESDNVTSRHHK